MEKNKKRQTSKNIGLLLFLLWIMSATLILSTAAATTGSGSTGESGFSWSWSTDNTNTGAEGAFDATLNGTTLDCNISAKSSTYVAATNGTCGGGTDAVNAKSTTVTATITNNTGSTIRVTGITCDKATVPDLAVGTSLESGKSFTIQLTAAPNNEQATTSIQTTDTVTITYTVVENINIVFYGAANVTYTCGEDTVSGADASATVTQATGATITLPEATVSSGTFKGWRMSDGSIQKPRAEVHVYSDSAVYPVVLSGSETYPYTVNENTYCFWEDAVYAAGTNGTIILNQDYTLPTTLAANGVSPAGGKFVKGTDGAVSYTIPNGVTLLIPFDDANTLYTTEPKAENNGTNKPAPTPYRTLTMAKGAKLVVNGSMSLSAKINAPESPNPGAGSPFGEVSFVEMEEGSSITVNNGGALYAWGYITGSGNITAKSGADIYECFQFEDFRGGTQMTGMKDGVFPLSQYYVQNIEVPLTIEKGASDNCYTAVYMRAPITKQVVGFGLNFMGSETAMFHLINGSVTKYYDGSTDRLVIDVNGEVNISNVSLTLSNSSIDSKDYVLPINSNITVNINDGSRVSVKQDLALLPGVIVNIAEKGNLTITSGYNMYIYDQSEWGAFCGTYGLRLCPLSYAPSRGAYNRSKDDLIDAKIVVNGVLDASEGYVYTTDGGANICSTGTGVAKISPGTETVTYQNSKNADNNTKISITSAKLKNGDGSYVETAKSTASPNTYTYTGTGENGKWICTMHIDEDQDKDCDACGKECVAEVNGTSYFTLKEAVGASNGNLITMLSNSDETDCTITGTVYLDLNGCTVTNVKLSGGTLYGADSASDGYQYDSDKLGSIAVTVASGSVAPAGMVNGKGYVAVESEGVYRFHRFAIVPTAAQFYHNTGSHSHLGFMATARSSSEAIAKMADVGFTAASMNTEGTVAAAGTTHWYEDETQSTLSVTGTKDSTNSWYEQTIYCTLLDLGSNDYDTPFQVTVTAAFDDNKEAVITGAAATTISLNEALVASAAG